MKPTPEEVAKLLGRALPPSDCSAAETAKNNLQLAQAALDRALAERQPDEYPKISAAIDANDRVRERRFAQGLPCLITGLLKEQWEARRIVAPVVNDGEQDRPSLELRWVKKGADMVLECWCDHRGWREVPFVPNAYEPQPNPQAEGRGSTPLTNTDHAQDS